MAKKRTKRERFLSEMEAVVPWKALIDLIEPHYPKTSSKGGLPPYPLGTMLRIHPGRLKLCPMRPSMGSGHTARSKLGNQVML